VYTGRYACNVCELRVVIKCQNLRFFKIPLQQLFIIALFHQIYYRIDKISNVERTVPVFGTVVVVLLLLYFFLLHPIKIQQPWGQMSYTCEQFLKTYILRFVNMCKGMRTLLVLQMLSI